MKSIDLFVGAGGLALGAERAGFRHLMVADWNKYACATIRANQARGHRLVKGWKVLETDVGNIVYTDYEGRVDLLAGGPPCQPFSLGGKHRGHDDHRDMFPQVFRAIRSLAPKAVLIENVKGLTRRSFAHYFSYLLLQLNHPELVRRKDEEWKDHLARLEQHHTKGKIKGLSYNVVFRVLNAADYGVPQKRERILFVAFRNDLGIEWSFPEATHSYEALLHEQWITGEYWDRHRVPRHLRSVTLPQTKEAMKRVLDCSRLKTTRPWMTVRDALVGLPEPSIMRPDTRLPDHVHIPGARQYHGHTGSLLDEPAKTLKAGDHGVPGGENTLVLSDGRVRYFTVRESARLQAFPDDYRFLGSWTEAMRQLGNAVPVRLAEAVCTNIRSHLKRRLRRS